MHVLTTIFSLSAFGWIFWKSYSQRKRILKAINDSTPVDVPQSKCTTPNVQDLGGVPSRIDFPGWAVPKK